MIVTELHEGPPYGRSQNGSLYGTDRRARRGRRLREHSGLDIKGEKGSYAKAQPSAPVGWRRRIQRAIELSANNAEVRQELQDLLDENVGSTDQD